MYNVSRDLAAMLRKTAVLPNYQVQLGTRLRSPGVHSYPQEREPQGPLKMRNASEVPAVKVLANDRLSKNHTHKKN